ncbi:hypothetical protein ABEB36_003812 [Hypothenemus hampei]|uniref:Uncharacterized protein n=1 Tax=Hypothenemus hampei TaxID=57062 RepID=A0ABD1F175_HYPHA
MKRTLWILNSIERNPSSLNPVSVVATKSVKCTGVHFTEFGEKSNSPNLNPMDFSLWDILEAKVSSKRYVIVAALKLAVV